MKSLKALVITAPGINCDLELSQAFAAAGAEPESILLSRLIRNPTLVDQFALIGLPGGFSYGDDIAAGRIMAALMRREMYPAIAAAITRGTPMICPCNGFQIAVQAGLLPGPTTSTNLHSSTSSKSGAWPNLAAAPTVALSTNIGERFHDGWTCVEIPSNTKCIWTRGLSLQQDCDMLPSAHGEGRLMTDVKTLETLEKNGQIALRYAAKDNFNGSMNAVAGICDPSGLVFGLMPHLRAGHNILGGRAFARTPEAVMLLVFLYSNRRLHLWVVVNKRKYKLRIGSPRITTTLHDRI